MSGEHSVLPEFGDVDDSVTLFNTRIAWKKNEVADGEATTFAIFYINTFFIMLVLGSFFFLRSFHPLMYPL